MNLANLNIMEVWSGHSLELIAMLAGSALLSLCIGWIARSFKVQRLFKLLYESDKEILDLYQKVKVSRITEQKALEEKILLQKSNEEMKELNASYFNKIEEMRLELEQKYQVGVIRKIQDQWISREADNLIKSNLTSHLKKFIEPSKNNKSNSAENENDKNFVERDKIDFDEFSTTQHNEKDEEKLIDSIIRNLPLKNDDEKGISKRVDNPKSDSGNDNSILRKLNVSNVFDDKASKELLSFGKAAESILSKEESEKISEFAELINLDRIGYPDLYNPDDLTKLTGVGPLIQKKLYHLGIYNYNQIKNLTTADMSLINEAINFFPEKIKKEEWQSQIKELMYS